jgi:hypothetical protein
MKIKFSIAAVLTGDIVNSTRLSPTQEKRFFDLLARFAAKHKYEIFRGDSFQIYVDDPRDALHMALVCRSLAIELTENGERYDVRISIGIGEVNLPIKNLGIAKGEAFLLSGRNFDDLGDTRRLAISCGNEIADIGLEVVADYLDNIYQGMTAKQAALITELLSGTTQQQVSITLNKAKSTISQLAAAGRWPEIEKLLQQYKNMIEKLFPSL